VADAGLDGRQTVRGAKDADGNQRHLLAVLAGRTAQSSVIAAQAEAGVKTNQVPMATEVPGQIDLHGKLVSADAPRSASPAGPWTGHSPSSASHHDLETAVGGSVSPTETPQLRDAVRSVTSVTLLLVRTITHPAE
jgi:hypothetical protein